MASTTIAGRPLVAGEEPLTKDNANYASWQPVTAIDTRDDNSPDSWVPRHPDLIRLTGRHPFNSEPPHKTIIDSGFITPVSVHLVRNHGAVPKLDWNTHRIEIDGLVGRPLSLSMDELVKLPTFTIPVLVSCCGNRRKEVNVVKKSQGFSWGPAAVAVNEWTGVRLADVLKLARVQGVEDGATHVCFCGPKGELPKGEDGSYGTSMPLTYAMHEGNDVMIAFKQNGQYLHPDHGFPCRMIIPGWIGGRMIKWLSHITVTNHESTNWYHYYDNKILPSHVDAELAEREGWWKKPEFILYDLVINSTIVYPGHDEVIYTDQNRPYKMRGYAYSGGGRRINRVEVTFDRGATWRIANLHVEEKPNAYGKYWCWCFWELEVTTFDFMFTDSVMCRAYDFSQNTQPEVLTWSLLGQGNGCMFELKIKKEVDSNGRIRMRFQQPAPVEKGALGNRGWREEEADAREGALAEPVLAAAVVAAAEAPEGSRVLTMEEVEKHNSEDSAWFVVDGKVYDGTPFLDEHPGGAESIVLAAGTDASDEFNSIHSKKAREMLAKYYIGDLVTAETTPATVPAAAVPAPVPKPQELIALDPRKKQPFKLQQKFVLSHNVVRFRFALQSTEHKFGLPIGKHVFLYATIGGETVMRAYTPTSQDDDLGYFDLVVKIYRPNIHPKFPDGGKMSQHLERMEIGDTIDVKGPVGHFVYDGRGNYTINGKKKGFVKRFCLIAGGTGITPVYQVMKAVLKDAEDKTELALLYANQCEDDILLREELDAWAEKPNVKVSYTLAAPPEGWKGHTGFINEQMLRDTLFMADSETLVLLCGPPPMLEFACYPNLPKLGYEKEQMIAF